MGVAAALRGEGYLADDALATSVFLALALEQPLLLEGEAGVGKTEAAKALAQATGARLIRLQCHEGIDVHQALYDWDYSRQLLALRAAETAERRRAPSSSAALPRSRRRRSRRSSTRARSCCSSTRSTGPTTSSRPPARAPLRLPGVDPELGTIQAPRRRSSSSPRTAPASCTTRSSVAASTTGSTTRRRARARDRRRPAAGRPGGDRRRVSRPWPLRRRTSQGAWRGGDDRLGPGRCSPWAVTGSRRVARRGPGGARGPRAVRELGCSTVPEASVSA